MKFILLLLNVWALIMTKAIAQDVCDQKGILLYEDMGCIPVKDDSKNTCPTKYNCPNIKNTDKQCFLQGKSYNIGDSVTEDVASPSCNAGCFCRDDDNKASFTCAILDCAEWLGEPLKPGCIRKYDLNKCCSTGDSCPPFDDSVKCDVDGTTYKEGQKFYPEGTCSVCVCQKGFAGKYVEPFCRKVSCAVQLKRSKEIEQNCAPLYRSNKAALCCPISWICPEDTDVIIPSTIPNSSSETCQFGNKELKLGESIERKTEVYGQEEVVSCLCDIPPLLTCKAKK